jgi:hypothetical protein
MVVSLVAAPAGQAQNAPAVRAAQQAAKQQVKLSEAEVLRQAYVALAAANHDYNGHRAKAMNRVQAAIRMLDASVMKKGTLAQKVVTVKEDAAAGQARAAARVNKQVHENQVSSDAQLRLAAEKLQSVRPILAQTTRPRALAHVDAALKEIGIALAIR